MGKYDALMAEVDDDEIQSKYGDLMAEVEDEPEPKATPSKPSTMRSSPTFGYSYDAQGSSPVDAVINKGMNYLANTAKGAILHPIQTLKGIGLGIDKSAAGLATDLAAGGNMPDDTEDINMTIPGRFPIRKDVPNYSSQDYANRKNELQNKFVKPLTENLTPQEARASRIGELALPASVSEVALGSPLSKVISKTASKTANKLGAGMQSTANRMQNVTTKILTKEADSGAKIENIGKYKLFGSPDEALQKGKDQVTKAYDELKSIIAEKSDDPINLVDANSAINRAKTKILKEEPNNRQAINDAFEQMRKDYFSAGEDGSVKGFYDSPVIDLAEAQMLKQKVGVLGDWHYLPINAKAEPAKGQAYKAFYKELQKELENKGGEKVKELNKIMSDIIPINVANTKRILVSSRKNPIPIDDMIGYLSTAASAAHGNFLPAGVTAANMISKSPFAAKNLYSLGEKIIPKAKEPIKFADEINTNVELPSDVNTPAFFRKGIEPKVITPIRDPKRLIGYNPEGLGSKYEVPLPTDATASAKNFSTRYNKDINKHIPDPVNVGQSKLNEIESNIQELSTRMRPKEEVDREIKRLLNDANVKKLLREKLIRERNKTNYQQGLIDAINSLRPKVTDEQDMVNSLRKFYTGKI